MPSHCRPQGRAMAHSSSTAAAAAAAGGPSGVHQARTGNRPCGFSASTAAMNT